MFHRSQMIEERHNFCRAMNRSAEHPGPHRDSWDAIACQLAGAVPGAPTIWSQLAGQFGFGLDHHVRGICRKCFERHPLPEFNQDGARRRQTPALAGWQWTAFWRPKAW